MRIVRPLTITDSNYLSSSVAENEYPTYNSGTSYTLGQRVVVVSKHRVYESLRGGSSAVTISQSNPAVIGLKNNFITNGTAVSFSGSGSLPAGITAGTTYYVVNSGTEGFNIATTPNGTAIATTSTGSGTFTVSDSPNLGKDPATSPSYWLDIGSTNKWKMFDQSVQSQTTTTTTLTFSIFSAGYTDTIPLLNISGATTARVQVTHGADGTVYDKTVVLSTEDGAVVDLLSYFNTGFKVRRDVVFEDIPSFASTTITVTLSGPQGASVGLGAAIFGLARDISSTRKGVEYGARIGIDDYSVKQRDDFGNFTILERAFAKRANFTIYVNNEDVDGVVDLLSDYRATPIVYIGSRKFGSTIVYGFYKTFDVEIAYPDVSICTIELDGLT